LKSDKERVAGLPMEFKIEIVARGEGLVYQDEDYTVNFSCGFNRIQKRFEVDLYSYSDKYFNKFKLPPEKEKQIVENIAQFFCRKKEKVFFNTVVPDIRLKSVDELLDERLNRRDEKS
jgi:hypothetical protein